MEISNMTNESLFTVKKKGLNNGKIKIYETIKHLTAAQTKEYLMKIVPLYDFEIINEQLSRPIQIWSEYGRYFRLGLPGYDPTIK